MTFVLLAGNALHDHVLRSTVAPPEAALAGMVARHCKNICLFGRLYKFCREWSSRGVKSVDMR